MSPKPIRPHYDLGSIQAFFSTDPDPDHISRRALQDAADYFSFGAAGVFECIHCLSPASWDAGQGNFYQTVRYRDPKTKKWVDPQDVYYLDFEDFLIYIKLMIPTDRGGYVVSFHERN